MISRSFLSLGLALLLALLLIPSAFAGGWAVVTLDDLPAGVQAGKPITIGFTVRQHGITLMNGLDPTVTATLSKEDHFVVQAKQDDQPGHYTATLTFPKEGSWEWSIQAFSMDQPMPVLTVAGANSGSTDLATPTVQSVPASDLSQIILSILFLGLGLAGLILAFQRKSRLAGAFAGLCLVVGISSLALGAASGVEAQGKTSAELSSAPAPSQAELGRQLFLAKGCITCHYNSRAADRQEYWTIEMGAPDLSNYSAHPEVLFIRLKDPVAAKSDAKMPNLGLKKTEIEALIAFINNSK